jgi:hypothetical protein
MKKLGYSGLFLILSYCLSNDLFALGETKQVTSRDILAPENAALNEPILLHPSDKTTGKPIQQTLQVSVSDPTSTDNLDVSFNGRAAGTTPGEDFTIVLIPDPQNESQYYPAIFTSMTEWIVSQKSAMNIVYVTTTGDMVNHASSTTEYDNVDTAIDKLDPADIPYSIGVGNHDQPTTNFNTYFGISRFSGKAWYGGHYGSTNDNSYSFFSASDMDFILINLEINPSGAILDWADALLKANPGCRGIVESHSILNIDNSWTNIGIYNALKNNPNLFLMLCGHMHSASDGAAYRSGSGDDGHTIHIMLADYQEFPNGGNGYMRILRFSPAANKIYATTYSPYINGSITSSTNFDQMEMAYDMEGNEDTFPPSAFNVIGGGSYCLTAGGLPVGLADSEEGVTYTLYKNSIAQSNTVAGTGASISFGNQTAGTYTVSGTNDEGTTTMQGSSIITENPTPPTPSVFLTQPICGSTNGTITVTAPKGAGMTYSINGSTYSNTSGIFTSVAAGTYNVSAKNASGCVSTGTSVTINANPTPPAPSVRLTQPTCGSTTGTITITAPTGAGMTYSINGSTYTNTTGIFPAVAVGTYNVTAKNASGCISTGTSVTINANPTPPAPSVILTQPTCGSTDGTITVTAPTGAGMTYSINGSTYSNTTGIFTAVAVGTYNVTAKTASGCVSTGTSVTINANPTPPAPSVTLTQPTCVSTSGTITITSPKGAGMTYSINGTTYSNTTGIFTLVSSGTYSVTARNSTGCISSGISAVIADQPDTPATPIITLNGNILHSNATDRNQWYNESGSINGATGQDYTPSSGGNYYVIVSNGLCSSNASDIISFIPTSIENADMSINIYLFPNPTHGKLNMTTRGEHPNTVIEVLNLQGQTVKVEKLDLSENQTEVNLEGLPKGTYFIKIIISGNSVFRTIILR